MEKIALPLSLTPLEDAGGGMSSVWFRFFQSLATRLGVTSGGVIQLASFTRSDLPQASKNPWGLVALSDGAGGKVLAVSDGTAWKYADGSLV